MGVVTGASSACDSAAVTTTLAGRYERGELVAEGPLGALYRGRTRGDAGFAKPVARSSIE